MKALKNVRIWMIYLLTLSLTSCGDDIVNYTMENTDEALCNKLWIDNDYVNESGASGTYQLRFFSDGNGEERTIIPEGEGGSNTIERSITWKWTDASKECVQYAYPSGTVKYLDNVWVREHYLSCEMDGQPVTFVEANYQH